MKCAVCKKKINQAPLSGTWYHKKTKNVFCYPKAVATPKSEVDANNWIKG